MTFEQPGKSAFVPKGDDRRATARVLVDLANDNGIPQTEIQSANDGFYISDRLADLLYDESETDEPTDEAPAETATKGKASAKSDKKRK